MKIYNPTVKYIDGNTVIFGVANFDLQQTFDCGQAFRWSPLENGNWCGIALGRYLEVGYKNGNIIFYNISLAEYEEKWREYFDIDLDYSAIIEQISQNEILKKAATQNKGIRILKQDSWEALCSFIISQNNNIPRIKGIIERLCSEFGEKIYGGYAFPTAKTLASLTPEDLAPIKCGFRARYIIDGAKKYLNNEINLEIIKNADTDKAREELMKIIGVGCKVADCTLLFGFHRLDALPKDVWIKRALDEYFSGKLPACALPYAGIAQQYLFNFIRHENNKKAEGN